MGDTKSDTKSLSPPTSISETSADAEPKTEPEADVVEATTVKMEVDPELKGSIEPPEERLAAVSEEIPVSDSVELVLEKKILEQEHNNLV